MFDWQAIVTAIDNEFGHPTAFAAIFTGLVCSFGFTQLFKGSPSLDELSDRRFRVVIRAMAFVFAAAPVLLLWPAPGIPAGIFAITTGLIAPSLYVLIKKIACHHWAWLDERLSARPGTGNGDS